LPDLGSAFDLREPSPARAAKIQHRECSATHSAVLPRAAGGCIAGMMRKVEPRELTSGAALLLS
jgi:hypothetical protein